MLLWAQATQQAAADGSAITLWAFLSTGATAVCGVVIALMRMRHVERLEELKSVAQQKQMEADARTKELAAIKGSLNAVHGQWKDISDMFQQEIKKVQASYVEKCVEIKRLEIALAEAEKRGQHGQP
jgi:hypothetical protein